MYVSSGETAGAFFPCRGFPVLAGDVAVESSVVAGGRRGRVWEEKICSKCLSLCMYIDFSRGLWQEAYDIYL